MVMDIFRNSPEQPSDSLAKSASCKDPILPQLGLHSMLLIQFLLIEDAQNQFMLRPGRTHLRATHEMAKQRGVAGNWTTRDNSVGLCYELLLKQQEGILTKQIERRIREHLCEDI